MNEELTIVVPSKNEEHFISRLLDSIRRQDYAHIRSTIIYVADAASSDATVETALRHAGELKVRIIPGGPPSEARNAGARLAITRFILFLDADVALGDRGLVRRAVELMKRRNLHCVTTFILATEGKFFDHLMYLGNSIVQIGSKYSRPFSPGAFMLFERPGFNELGSFNALLRYAEDY